ncbi:MAG: MarR family transcriptional regulator [Microthrixaceae bacterium]|nr:MarR family transcriptional regulator [Microthrixaceae bacterium]
MNSESTAWDNFRLAHDRVVGRLHADLTAACSISLSDFEILANLNKAEKRQLRMTQLAELSGLSPSGLTRRFDSLANRGLVSRETCDDDRRGVVAVLTKDGAKVVKSATPVYNRGTRDYFFEVLGDKSAKTVGSALGKVAEANEAE